MSINFQRRGILCIVSGPSGSGKTTLCRKLSEADQNCRYAVSCTTRKPRDGEEDGRDYHFLDREDFEARATRGELLEWAEVHGNLYGTLKSEVLDLIQSGRDVLMDIDVQGAGLVRNNPDEIIRESLVDIFILPPNRDELVKRLSGRGAMDPAELELRLDNALEEMRHWRKYAYTIVTGSPEEDFSQFQAIIAGERCRTWRLQGEDPSESHPDLFS